MEDEILGIIADTIKNGYYSGMFDILDDNTEKYTSVYWTLTVDTQEDE